MLSCVLPELKEAGMAKISARGDSEHARWRHPETGAELVLTLKGRLLLKAVRGGSFTLAGRCEAFHGGQRVDQAAADARRRGMERV